MYVMEKPASGKAQSSRSAFTPPPPLNSNIFNNLGSLSPVRGATRLVLVSTLLLGLLGVGSPGAVSAQTACVTSSAAVTGFTAPLDDLVTDCTTLLGLKDTLIGTGTGSLNWAANLGMDQGDGVSETLPAVKNDSLADHCTP